MRKDSQCEKRFSTRIVLPYGDIGDGKSVLFLQPSPVAIERHRKLTLIDVESLMDGRFRDYAEMKTSSSAAFD